MKAIKKWFFKTCPKSGCIVGINKKNIMLKVLFPLLGLAAFIWFLIRVVPKPSRITYPCQRIAAPLALSFLSFFSSTVIGWQTVKKFSRLWKNHQFYRGVTVLFTGICLSALFYIVSVDNSLVGQVINKQIDNGSDMGLFSPTDPPNTPMGVARGIHPGRVSWAFDRLAASWDGKKGLYTHAAHNSQTRINDMMEGVVLSLTHHTTLDKAWKELFTEFNKKKGKGDRSYTPGEKIAIKINLNNNGGTNIVDATPQSVYALLYQLVEIMQVPQECITIYDAQRRGISAVFTYNYPLFPGVIYQDWGGFVPDVITYSSEITDEKARGLARAAYEADYMINMALLKRHARPTDSWKDSAGQTGITGTGKNHFGSIGNVSPLHLSIRDWSAFRGMGSYNSIVDLMSHERLGENTLLFLIDGLYPTPIHNGQAIRFNRPPFNGGWASSFFASQDQVAIESVLLDFISSEIPVAANADNFMHEAALIGDPPSGVPYVDKHLKSLGVHEHWNNPEERMYSRNLGKGEGIELYRVPLDTLRPAIEYFYADKPYCTAQQEVTIRWKSTGAERMFLNDREVPAAGEVTIQGATDRKYTLSARSVRYGEVKQELIVFPLNLVNTYQASQARLNGSAKLNPENTVEFKGEKGTSTGSLTWNVTVPEAGNYLMITGYSGNSPVPSYLYVNGTKVSDHFGYLATSSNKSGVGEYLFPVVLQKGANTIMLEHAGRRSNQIHHITLAKEK